MSRIRRASKRQGLIPRDEPLSQQTLAGDCLPAPYTGLNLHHIRGLRPLGPLDDVKFDVFPFLECLKPFSLKGRIMDKDVLPTFHPDEAEPLAVVKPFDSAFALHTALLSYHDRPPGRTPLPTVLAPNTSSST